MLHRYSDQLRSLRINRTRASGHPGTGAEEIRDVAPLHQPMRLERMPVPVNDMPLIWQGMD